MIENNLFYYATKELSQDAFICWLCSHALENADNKDEAVEKCAHKMIRVFAGAGDKDEVKLLKIEKQIGNIDVLLTIEVNGAIYKVIVEDKTHSYEHDDQLSRYYEEESKKSGENVVVRGVYFKTGFQADYSSVTNAGYSVIDRKTTLNILKEYAERTSSDILKDYYDYWQDFEDISRSYTKNGLSKWDWRAVNGFFEKMKAHLNERKPEMWSGYGYVANRSGGFWGFWYGSEKDHITYGNTEVAIYLQSEIAWNYDANSPGYVYKQCLKLEEVTSENDGEIREIRDQLVHLEKKYGFRKPDRLGYGQHMTVGIYDVNQQDYESSQIEAVMFDSLDKYIELLEAMRKQP